jgi:hypothetical protein
VFVIDCHRGEHSGCMHKCMQQCER